MSARLQSIRRAAIRGGWVFVLLVSIAGCNDDDSSPSQPPPPPPPVRTYTVGGSVSGLDGTVVLVNNGGDARTLDANGTFTFATPVAQNAAYAVTVQTQPANQTCTVSNGSGTATANVTAVVVACETVRVAVTVGTAGGTVLGPDGVQVEIPPDALTQDTVIGIARSSAGAAPPPSDELRATSIYEFTPHDVMFEQPVTIRMPVPANADNPVVLMAGLGFDWSDVEAQIENGTASFARSSFSWGGPYMCAFTPGDPNTSPDGCVTSGIGVAPSSIPAAALTSLGAAASVRRYRLTESATVRFSMNYRVPGTCINAVMRIRRGALQANGTVAQPLTMIAEHGAPLTVNGSPPPGLAATGVTAIDVPMDHTMSGRWVYSTQLSCMRNGRERTFSEAIYIENTATAPAVTYSIGGTVSSLTGSGLVLQNNAADDLAIATDGPFTFATQIGPAAAYDVRVRTQPSNPTQACSVQNGAGTAQSHVTNIAVDCTIPAQKAWQTAGLISNGMVARAQLPQVGFDGAGNAIAAWLSSVSDPVTGNSTVEIWSNRYTRSAGWETPVRVTQIVDGEANRLRLAVLANGEAVAVWEQASGPVADIYSSRYLVGSGWAAPAAIDAGLADVDSLSIGFSSGAGFAIWLQDTGPSQTEDVWVARYAAGLGWSAPVLIEERDDGAGSPAIAASADGTAIAVWEQSDNDQYLRTNRYVPGTGWTGAATLTQALGYPGNEPVIAMDDAGQAVVAYHETGFSGAVFGLRYAGGAWSSPEPLRASSVYVGRLNVAMHGTGEALVMWVEGEGATDIWAKPYGVLSGAATSLGDGQSGGVRPDMAFGPDGTALAVWNHGVGDRVLASRYTHGATPSWSTPVEVVTGMPARDAQIAIDRDGNAIAVWYQALSSSQWDIAASVYR